MRNLSIDIETMSEIDIGAAGAYRYAQGEQFKILLFAFAFDNEDVRIIDLANGEEIPLEIREALVDPEITKHAYNAAFEWWCLNMAGYATDLDQWECTMINALYCGFPGSLAAAGAAVGLPEEKQKLTTGKALIRYFCCPCKPTKTNGGRTWNKPEHDPEKWELFKTYCKQDVVTEREIWRRICRYKLPESEWQEWRADVRMNAYGVRVDAQMITSALAIDEKERQALTLEAARITGLENPNSPSQTLAWLSDQGIEADNLQKATVSDLLQTDLPDHVRRVLEIRQQLGKTSIKKYDAMAKCKGPDDRIRGLMQFYGANRTGRWAGRLVQMQNLPRNYLQPLGWARQQLRDGNSDALRVVYGNVADTMSQLIRTTFIPSEGRHFVVADFSAIEARVIGWLAGEEWVNKEFAGEGKIYEATASQMFGVPKELIRKGNPEYSLRQKGKIATLALGYQGGVNAMLAMGADKMGLSEDELQDIVTRWRSANPHIVRLWYDIEEAALKVMQTGQPQTVRGVTFRLGADLATGLSFMTIELPTCRRLYYPKPEIKTNRFGREALHYWTVDQQTRKWTQTSTYGGKLTENVVQAIARDCLAVTLQRIRHVYGKRAQVVFHVHDEVILDAEMDITDEHICGIMAQPIPWAIGLRLKGAGFTGDYYMKD